MVRIPSEYQEVEYLESTGTQYIDTDHVPTLNTKAHVVFSATVKNTIGFFGSRKDPYRFCCTTYSKGTTFGLNVCKNSWTSNKLSLNINTIYDCEFGNGFSKINGEEFLEPTLEEWDDTIRAFVLSGVDSAGTRAATNAKYYLCELWESNVVVRRLIPCYRKSDNEPGMYDTVSKTFFTNSGTGTFLVGNDVNYSNTNLLEVRRRILLNTPHIESMSGNPAVFTTDMAVNLKECKIHFTPVQAGEGTPSPENVRAISGWDGVTVTRCGKNLIPEYSDTEFWNKSAWFDGGGTIRSNSNYKMCDYKTILPGRKYVLSTETNSWKGIGFYDEFYSPLAFSQLQTTNLQLICPNNAKYYRVYSTWNAKNHQFEEDKLTEYEPYAETSLTIHFPQTVYGGYVDLMKGEIVEEWIKKTLVGSEIYNTGKAYRGTDCTNAYVNISPKAYGNHATSRVVSDSMDKVNTSIWASADSYPNAFTINNGIQLHICLPNSLTGIESSDTDAQCGNKFKAFIQNNNINFAYLLATPNVYPLTPQTIKALKGLNNLYSDANGNIEVKFWKH